MDEKGFHVNRQVSLSFFVELVLLASLIVGSWVNLQRQLDGLQRDVKMLLENQGQFVSKVEPTRSAINLAGIIREVIPLVENEFRIAGITLHVNVDNSLPNVIADKIQIEQVLLNLTRNALEAMRSGDADGGKLDIKATAHNGFLEVAVRDTGQGIPDDDLDEVFSTFYSTKPEGMGMGLAISRSIIEAHGGRIRAASNSDRGTTFTFTLPTATDDEDSITLADPADD